MKRTRCRTGRRRATTRVMERFTKCVVRIPFVIRLETRKHFVRRVLSVKRSALVPVRFNNSSNTPQMWVTSSRITALVNRISSSRISIPRRRCSKPARKKAPARSTTSLRFFCTLTSRIWVFTSIRMFWVWFRLSRPTCRSPPYLLRRP